MYMEKMYSEKMGNMKKRKAGGKRISAKYSKRSK